MGDRSTETDDWVPPSETLRESLESIDTAYFALSLADRTPDNLRKLAIEFVRSVQLFVDPEYTGRSVFACALEEALLMAQDGKMHPLLAVTSDDRVRARPAMTISAIQARAGALLEYACVNHGMTQNEWATKIASTLGKCGLRMAARDYSADAVIKWRTSCSTGDHLASSSFRSALEEFRNLNGSPRGYLQILAWWCERELGPARGNPHSRFSK